MTPDRDAGDPFDILGLPPVFDLDPGAVARAYLAIVARLHPDIAQGDPEAATRSAAANLARSTLENPESRANALLARLGGPAKETDRSLPQGFLAGMMETREQLEAAEASQDATAVRRWTTWAAEQRLEYSEQVAGLFRRLAEAADRPAALRRIRLELNAWRYVERLIEQLENRPGPVDTRPHPPGPAHA